MSLEHKCSLILGFPQTGVFHKKTDLFSSPFLPLDFHDDFVRAEFHCFLFPHGQSDCPALFPRIFSNKGKDLRAIGFRKNTNGQEVFPGEGRRTHIADEIDGIPVIFFPRATWYPNVLL